MRIELNSDRAMIVDDDISPEILTHKWHATRDGYVRRSFMDKSIYLHRVIMNAPTGMEVDHINGNKLDNRRCNLRVCHPWQNKQNAQKTKKPTLSKYRGVTKTRGRWCASIKHDGKNIWIGRFTTEEDAALAYNWKALQLFGEYAGLNQL